MKKQTIAVALAFAVLSAACGNQAPTAPTASATPQRKAVTISYDINVPTVALAESLHGQYPAGVALPPAQAQQQFDFRAAYRGTPNVYYGASAPQPAQYLGVGIVVAPLAAASKLVFTAADWPGMDPDTDYTWLGRFAYAAPAQR